MSGNILDIRNFRKISVQDYLRKGNRTWDIFLTINAIPFKIVDFKIVKINREQLEISYMQIVHDAEKAPEEKCTFCGQSLEKMQCPKINQEHNELFFEKIFPQMETDLGISDIILSDIDPEKTLRQYQNTEFPVDIRSAGVSEDGVMLFFAEYKQQWVMIKEYTGEGSEYQVPTVLFEGDQGGELFVHLEFLLPENFANLLLAMEAYLKQEEIEIFNITEVSDLDFWNYVKNKEEKK